MTTKAPNIGLSQGHWLCQMRQSARLAFIAEGLPAVLTSAQGFWRAAGQLDGQVREAVVLARHAEEEAAKVLILMDIVRCPRRLVSARTGSMVKWFYSHLARLIYAEAAGWKPMDVAQSREYVDMNRKSHHVDGAVGEYIGEAQALTRTLLKGLIAEELPAKEAEDKDVQLLYEVWQLPMYNIDFGLIEVPLEDLQNEQEALLWGEIGECYY